MWLSLTVYMFLFFLNDTATTEISPLSLPDALPILHGYPPFGGQPALKEAIAERYAIDHGVDLDPEREVAVIPRSEEHTSELQSRQYLVCRLLLEKKKNTLTYSSTTLDNKQLRHTLP